MHPKPVDEPQENRPGVPREKRPPEPIAPSPSPPSGREIEVEVLVDPTRRGVTPVFGTQHPPGGLSGVLRRAAYRLPDYRVRRWLLLLLADRVDEQESRLARLASRPAFAWGLIGFGLLGTGLRLGKPRR